MNKIAIAIAVSLLAGLAVGAYLISSPQPATAVVSSVDPANYFDQTAATETRLRALEAAVAQERNARQLLEDELQILYAEIGQLSEERDERRAIDEQFQEVRQRTRSEFNQRAQTKGVWPGSSMPESRPSARTGSCNARLSCKWK